MTEQLSIMTQEQDAAEMSVAPQTASAMQVLNHEPEKETQKLH